MLYLTEQLIEKAPAMLATSRGTTPEASPMQDHDTPNNNLIPYGYCHCGCGGKTTAAKRNYHGRGIRKGDPARFLPGHFASFNTGPRKPRPLPIPISPDTALMPLVGNKGAGYFAIVDARDLEEVSQHRWKLHRVGRISYAATTPVGERGTTLLLHRLLIPDTVDLMVDHRNGNALDNRRANLRLATPAQNAQNSSRYHHRPISPFRGVMKAVRSEKWRAHISVNGKTRVLGFYETAIEAAQVYDDAARKFHGEFAVLNFPEIGERGDKA